MNDTTLINTSSFWKKLTTLANDTDALLKATKKRLQSQTENSLTLNFDQISIDFSKQLLSQDVAENLYNLAKEKGLEAKIKSLFKASSINDTEDRAAAHWLLRGDHFHEEEKHYGSWTTAVELSLKKMESIINKVLSGHWRGYSGKSITDIVNLGVGGSELGPLVACHALTDHEVDCDNPVEVHFASSIDGSQLSRLLQTLEPETTLFLLASKSFTTIDTFSNAKTVKKWMASFCTDENLILRQHFIGISASSEKMMQWGLPESNQLLFWEWVGGRFSLWSSIGFPIALKIGMSGFRKLLDGAYEMDKHFISASFDTNLPVLLGLVGIWNVNFLNICQHAILPYDGRLKYFPQYLQQLEMESNGKSVTHSGAKVDYSTCPVIWGEVGPNAQHAFYQLLHQGTQKVSSDFIAVINRYDNVTDIHSRNSLKHQHILSLANCFAQSRVLLFGDDVVKKNDTQKIPAYKKYPGGQPSSTILLEELTPYTLGLLIALYEHKVFVQSVIWDINPFDQWGVELGKIMAQDTVDLLTVNRNIEDEQLDISTLNLIKLSQQQTGDSK